MAVKDVTSRCWILSLFIRDDGQRLLLGDGDYVFKDEQMHFVANTFENDVVDVQGGDGTLLAGQVRRASTQSFDGYVGDSTVSKSQIEVLRRQFFMFFRKNHHYKVIYVFSNGEAVQRRNGFIVDAPEIQELYQIHPMFHVAVNFEDVNYYAYNEDEDGNEIYGKSAVIPSAGESTGGLVWDEYGVVWDSIGAEWEDGSDGSTTVVSIDSIDYVRPVWTVTGPAVDPSLSNSTTSETIYYSGTVTSSQTLVIDMQNKTAKLNGTSVVRNVSGNWVKFSPGNNVVSYSTTNSDAPISTIEWQEVVG